MNVQFYQRILRNAVAQATEPSLKTSADRAVAFVAYLSGALSDDQKLSDEVYALIDPRNGNHHVAQQEGA